MQRAISFLVVYVSFTTISGFSAKAQDLNQLKAFSCDGLVLHETTLQQFKSKYRPTSYIRNHESCDRKNGVESFTVIPMTAPCDAILCEFFDGRVFRLTIVYTAERVTRLGGFEGITNTIMMKYGAPTQSGSTTGTNKVHEWRLPEAKRCARLGDGDSVIFTVWATNAEERLADRRAANTNLGF
jgi:hypothetical protein